MDHIEFVRVEGNYYGDIKIFALSTCGWCKKTKAFLGDHGIAYSYVDVDLLDGAAKVFVSDEQRRFNPRGTFPTIVYNNAETVIGYDPSFLNRLLEEG